MPFTVVLIEDEPLSRIFLKNLLLEFCPEVSVIGTASTEEEAIECITCLRPDLVFLDIELQQGSGLEVLKHIDYRHSRIVFTTAFDHHAVKAIQFSGVDYLQKPIDLAGLQEILKTVCFKKDLQARTVAIEHLLATLGNGNVPIHLAISSEEHSVHVPIMEIVRVESCNNDLHVYAGTKQYKSENTNLKEYESLLKEHRFFRVHLSHLINLDHIGSVHASGEEIVMRDGSKVPVSPRKLDDLKKILAV